MSGLIGLIASFGCGSECSSVANLLEASDPNEFVFEALSSTGLQCSRTDGEVLLRATTADAFTVEARAASELLAEVSASSATVGRRALDDDRNLFVCIPPPGAASDESLTQEACGLVVVGERRKAAATMVVGAGEALLTVGSEQGSRQATSIGYGAFLDDCVAASRRECAEPSISLGQCVALAQDFSGCSVTQLSAFFSCESRCETTCESFCAAVDDLE